MKGLQRIIPSLALSHVFMWFEIQPHGVILFVFNHGNLFKLQKLLFCKYMKKNHWLDGSIKSWYVLPTTYTKTMGEKNSFFVQNTDFYHLILWYKRRKVRLKLYENPALASPQIHRVEPRESVLEMK